jgi:hypothetical protein
MTTPFDPVAYERRVRTGPCFACAALRGTGTPYADQQFAAVMTSQRGVLPVTDAEQAALAARLRDAVARPGPA